MKTVLMTTGFALSSLVFVGCVSRQNREPRHILKEDGKVQCEVVVADEAGPVAQFAAKEMGRFLSRSLGAEVPLLKQASGGRTAIILGRSAAAEQAGVNLAKLARDGFVIKSVGRDIVIAGRDDMKVDLQAAMMGGSWSMHFERGTVFGAYEFLERFAGFRFYFPGELGTIIPKHDKLAIPAADIYEKPDFTKRAFCNQVYPGEWLPGEGDAHLQKSLMDVRAYRLETKYVPCCHGLSSRGYLKRFEKSHPEFFALKTDGNRFFSLNHAPFSEHLCLSSGIREEIYLDAKSYLSGEQATVRGIMTRWSEQPLWDPSCTQPGYYDLMPNDGFYKCQCEKCKPHWKDDQAASDFVWGMVAEVAARLKSEGVPGCVTMMAYPPYVQVPSIALPDNVRVMVACAGPWGIRTLQEQMALIDAWQKKAGKKKIWLWNYSCKFGKLNLPGIPASTPLATATFYKRVAPYVFGAFLETDNDPDPEYYMQHYLNHYVFGKVAWKNSVDVEALLREHHRLMFGRAATQMGHVFKAFEDRWLQIIGEPIDTPLGPQSIVLSDSGIWNQVYTQKEIARLEGLFNKSEQLVAGDELATRRVKMIRERFYDPIKKERALYVANQTAVNDLRFYVKELPRGTAPRMDGKTDEDVWKEACHIAMVPYATAKAQKEIGIRTTVRALRDADNLYFAFDCEEPAMDKLLSSAKRKPDDREVWKDSSLEIFLNPSGDRQGDYYQLLINSSGVLADLAGNRRQDGADWSWNSRSTAAVCRGAASWTMEVSIPLKSLCGLDLTRDFPANFTRNRILSNRAADYAGAFTWSPFLRNGFNDLDNFGTITFKAGQAANVIRNSSFTGAVQGSDFDGWHAPAKLNAAEGCEVVGDPATESGRCLRMTRTTLEKGALRVTQYLPELKPDTEYFLSYMVKITDMKLAGGDASGVVVNIWDDKNQWFPKNFFVSDMSWMRQGFKFKSGPDANRLPHKSYIMLTLMDAAATVYFGDVKLVEVEKPQAGTRVEGSWRTGR